MTIGEYLIFQIKSNDETLKKLDKNDINQVDLVYYYEGKRDAYNDILYYLPKAQAKEASK